MRLTILLIIVFLHGCNPERVEKLEQSLESTENVLDILALPNIESNWDSKEVEERMLEMIG